MNQKERIDVIYDLINKEGRVLTNELATIFDTTEQTIRKDLRILEQDRKIIRVHGGAKRKYNFNERLIVNSEVKKELCKIAASRVEDGDVIFIDGGTSYYYLFDYLPSDISLYVVTASLPIAEKVISSTTHKVHLLGGEIDRTTFESFGNEQFEEIRSLIFDISFFGTSGFSEDFGFTEENDYSIALKRQIRRNTKETIIIADATKEGKMSNRKAFELSEIDVLITDNIASEDLLKELEKVLKVIVLDH